MNDELLLLEAQQDIHELIAQQAPLEQTQDAIAVWISAMFPGAVVAFMRFDPANQTLNLLPCQRFSPRYFERLQQVPIGPESASFGAAAYHRRQVITEDIRSDPRWAAFRSAAIAEGFRACWSSPVITTQGELLGTFGTYYSEATAPSELSKRRLRQAAALIALAIVRDRDSRQHRTLAEWHRSLFVNHPDGHTCRLEVTNFPVTIDGKIDGVYGICHDITQRKHQEAELRLLQRGIEASPNGTVMVDATQHDMPIVYANEAFFRLTGYRLDDVLGRNCRFLQGTETQPEEIAAIRQALATHSDVQVTLLNYRKDGTPFWNRLAISPVLDDAGRCTHYIGILEDISRQLSQEARIAYQATHDLLTDLPNRAALEARLEQDFRWSQQHQRLLAVMYLDLDGFKAINDGLGYPVGNRLLMAIAERLRQQLGPHDTVGRLTGDEFAFLMPNFADHNEVGAAADRILAVLQKPFAIEGHNLHISASIGVACASDDIRDPHELIQHADLAVATAKQQGRNIWQWYRGDGGRDNGQHAMLRHDFQTALRDSQFELYYQPIVEAASGEIRSVEALVRWHHPERGMVSPGVFIPMAEQTGQIIDLGRWVMRQACQSLAELRAKAKRVYPVAINISSLQFRRHGFLDEVRGILAETGLPPELLELEVTESILLGGAEEAIEIIRILEGMNITVAIDDFGTGFSSLSYLRDLPIHKIKLDRAFIRDILTNHSNAAIVQGIIAMAHHMGLEVVAEGIEEPEQQQDLVRRDCDMLQGFYFARPMPLEALVTLPDHLPVGTPEAS